MDRRATTIHFGFPTGQSPQAAPDLQEKKRNLIFSFLIPAEAAALAAEAPLQDFLEEATCSICLDFFKDPVLIPRCGHNFCRDCLTRSCGASESEASCPLCRQTFAPRSVLPNRQLAQMAEVAGRFGGHPEEEGGSFCPKHREPLKLFCKDHQTLICVVCDRSKEHKGQWVIPAEEAFQEYQRKVEDCLKAQKEQKEKIATYKRDTEEKMQEMLDLIKKERENVVAEFRELQLWLEGQEKLLLTRMEETEKDIMARKEKGLAKHMEELCSLDHLIQEIEEKLQQPASKLLQDIGGILKKYSGKWIQLHKVNVTLDPETANHAGFDVSEDQKSVRRIWAVKGKYIFSDYNRYYHSYVHGCQTFSTGRHFWEVIVGDETEWDIGVIKKTLNFTNVDEQTRRWMFGKFVWGYWAFSKLEYFDWYLDEKPKRIRVSLNCEGGQVSFFDASTGTLLHTFSDASLVGETLRPCFCLYEGACLMLP
ncbi:E3 ubiquitin-protein ligase TRIM39-like isoform X1 [Thamnophis elegans]|uniref:E3 ubiquitin-protein ligase TRIM39-like isoform X1 n=1 Tax=Thamnophis elegans TaxID=35005 RepID=UPI0013779171|nr:E3 ubiquitin-protein ligase TRIM39-like isoform X1 [Thamnophis elegans]